VSDPNAPKAQFPPNIQAALDRGDKIEAIKLLRTATGLGLKEAKDVIDGQPQARSQRSGTSAPSVLPADVMGALQRGEKLEAIKLLREATGLGLKEAKDVVETALSRQGAARKSKLAPGEVQRNRPTAWVVVGVVITALLLWYFLPGAE
jgi:ribosomal protein L7/L12